MAKTYSLVILAAGLGSRFGGGIKQLEQVGPSKEIIMDYSIHDAIEAGFNQVVFIIRRDIEAAFRAVIGERIEAVCKARGVGVAYAYQDVADLPGDFVCPPDRTKPWGTGHALLACSKILKNPFVVINADDYYGKEAFTQLFGFLAALPEGAQGKYCMAGFRLGNTLSAHGGVTRGICKVDEQNTLLQIKETKNVIKTPDGAGVQTEQGVNPLPMDAIASMNFWGFTPDVLQLLDAQFQAFLAENLNVPQTEFVLPVVLDKLLFQGRVAVTVLPTEDRWFGMTYQQDVPAVLEAFGKLHEDGVYPDPLFA